MIAGPILETEPIKIKLISADGKILPSSFMQDELKKMSLKHCKMIKILHKSKVDCEQNMCKVLIENFGNRYISVEKKILDHCTAI